MSSRTATRLIGALAVPALGLGLAACGTEEPAEGTDGGKEEVAAISPMEAVQAAVQGLDGDSYKMDSSMTVDGTEFMVMTTTVDGENAQAVGDMYMSAMMEASGEAVDPAMAEMFGDMHTESIIVGDTAYLQFTGGMFDAMSEEYGEDAWFTIDLAGDSDMAEVYSQFGGMDLASQTELMLTELTDVEETGDGVYTGTLDPESEAMQGLAGEIAGADAAAMEAIDVTVTLDDDGLLKSMTMTLPETDGMTMEMVSEVVEIGGSYDIAAPASANLVPFEEFMGGLGGM
jgi:hypothetical protein